MRVLLPCVLLAGCQPCPLLADEVWLFDGSEPRRLDVDLLWGSVARDAEGHVWTVRDDRLFEDDTDLGPFEGPLVRVGDSVVGIESNHGEAEGSIAVRWPIDGDPVVLAEPAHLWTVYVAATDDAIALAWQTYVDGDWDQPAVSTGWLEGGEFVQDEVATGYQLAGLSANGRATLLRLYDDPAREYSAVMRDDLDQPWEPIELGAEGAIAEVGPGPTVWDIFGTSVGDERTLTLESLDSCSVALPNDLYFPAMHPLADGVEVFSYDLDGAVWQLTFDRACTPLSEDLLAGPYEGLGFWRSWASGGSTPTLMGTWSASEQTDQLQYWYSPGCH